MGATILGPRLGKYVGGRTRPILGHNMPLAALGAFMLWFGWFGFNGGSVLSADPKSVSLVFVTTTLGAAAGVVAAMGVSWSIQRKPDLSMILNGALAGLVGVTAGADVFSPMIAVAVGAVAGVVVVVSVIALDRLQIDDPVGAISVHLICGIWGTLAVGLFVADKSLVAQLMGVGMTAALCVPTSALGFFALKKTIGLRVSRDEELVGLDIAEHGQEAYAGFQIFSTQ